MSSESSIESQCRSYIKSLNGEFLKIQRINGWPDRLVLLPNGRCFFLELKRPNGKLSLLQKYTLERLQTLGFEAFELDNIALFKKLVKERL